MQLRRSWVARAVALLTATCLLVLGLGALRHETAVAHVRDGLTGHLQHAHALAEHHANDTTPHLHGRDVAAHAEAAGCALLAALDHATILPTTPVEAETSAAAELPALAFETGAVPALARYRLAPKTSPPTLA